MRADASFKTFFQTATIFTRCSRWRSRLHVYLTDMQSFAEMNEVYAKHFAAPYPARTTVAAAALPLGAAVEIEMIAS